MTSSSSTNKTIATYPTGRVTYHGNAADVSIRVVEVLQLKPLKKSIINVPMLGDRPLTSFGKLTKEAVTRIPPDLKKKLLGFCASYIVTRSGEVVVTFPYRCIDFETNEILKTVNGVKHRDSGTKDVEHTRKAKLPSVKSLFELKKLLTSVWGEFELVNETTNLEAFLSTAEAVDTRVLLVRNKYFSLASNIVVVSNRSDYNSYYTDIEEICKEIEEVRKMLVNLSEELTLFRTHDTSDRDEELARGLHTTVSKNVLSLLDVHNSRNLTKELSETYAASLLTDPKKSARPLDTQTALHEVSKKCPMFKAFDIDKDGTLVLPLNAARLRINESGAITIEGPKSSLLPFFSK